MQFPKLEFKRASVIKRNQPGRFKSLVWAGAWLFAGRFFGDVEGCGDSGVGELLIEAEEEDAAVGFGEFGDGGVDVGGEVGPGGVGGGLLG